MRNTSCREANLNNSFISYSEFENVDFENASFAHAGICKNLWEDVKLHNSDFRNTRIYVEDYAELEKYDANMKWAAKKKDEFFR